MNNSFSPLLFTALCAWLGLTKALPVRSFPVTDRGASQTRSPLLRSLILSGNGVSLLPGKPFSSDYDTTGHQSSPVPEIDTKLGRSYSTISMEASSVNTDISHSRGARSVTFSDTQAPVEPTTENTQATEITSNPIQEETTTVPKEEVTQPETSESSSTEVPTSAPAEVVLDQEYLDYASRQVDMVLAKVQYQNKSIGGMYINCYEPSRPRLPSDVVDNSKQCLQIQPTLQAMHEVLTDFLSYLEGLNALNGDKTVEIAVKTLDMYILFIPSPPLYSEYISTAIQGTDTTNTEEVVCTLQTLSTQARVIKEVVLNLKNC